MNREREMKTLIIAALVISVVAIGVGFAAFSTTLQINGTASVDTDGKTWSVFFSGVEKTTASTEGVETTAPTIANGTGENSSNAVINAFKATFSAPGQKIQYKVTVKNAGTYTAKLTNLSVPSTSNLSFTGTGATATTDAANVKKHVTFSFTKSAGGSPAVGDTIAAGATQDYLLTVEYEDFSLASDLPTAAVDITIPQITLTFSQS